LTKQLETFHPVRVAFHEYIALARDVRVARGWRTKSQVLLRGPGWEPPPEAPRGRSAEEPAT
jgi:hypothetical protein